MAEYQEYLYSPSQAIDILTLAKTALEDQCTILTTMRALTVSGLAASTQEERDILGDQFLALGYELDNIVSSTTYDSDTILANTDTFNQINMPIRTTARGLAIWDDDNNNIFGPLDVSTSHHINVKFGLYDTPEDEAEFNNGTALQAFSPAAPNYVTIQFGQSDSNATFKRDDPSAGIFLQLFLTGPTSDINAFYNPGDSLQALVWGPTTTTKIQTLQEILDNLPPSSGSTHRILTGDNIVGIPRLCMHIDHINDRLSFMVNALNNQELSIPTPRRNIRKKLQKDVVEKSITREMRQQFKQSYFNINRF